MADGQGRRKTQSEVDGEWAEVRRPGRTYISKSTPKPGEPGVPARYIHRVFDPERSQELEVVAGEGSVWLVKESEHGRHQIKLLVAREAGHVSESGSNASSMVAGNHAPPMCSTWEATTPGVS